ncbi:DMT family transporter [Actinopolymorpha alba]|uniref:DMT family transporter n=1 Tax=Actinopolymorpha alba TaxID=533267 RepID=UPI00036E2C2C|nr:DMT family transporter [Actinopolymorpha alba]
MEPTVVGAVLVAAALHAVWNAIAKAIKDQRIASALIGSSYVPIAGVAVCFLPLPDRASWPYLAASAIVQSGYLLLLVNAYRHGEFSRVYPLARGTAPLVVTVVAVAFLDERLTSGQLAGIVAVSLALTSLVFVGGRPPAGSGRGLALAVATGLAISTYTLIDGIGVRQSGHAVSYAMWLFLLQGPVILLACKVMYGRGFWSALAGSWPLGLLGGVLSLVTYAIVVWAQSRSPLALVSALRETSVVFAGVIGAVVFAERFSAARTAMTVLAVLGVVLMKAG